MNIYDLVQAALLRQQAHGIVGWGLDNPDANLFDCVEEGQSYGCTSQTCFHTSHDPAAPTYKLVPRRGTLVRLGSDEAKMVDYYGLFEGDQVLAFIKVYEPQYYWAFAHIVDSVPDWCLSALATN